MMEQLTPEQLNEVLQRLQVLEDENRRFQHLTSRLAEENTVLSATTPPGPPPQSNAQVEKPLPALPRLALPEKFDGNRENFRGFINSCELLFANRPDYYTDTQKIVTIGSLLVGQALEWFNPFIENPGRYQKYLENYSEFKKLFQSNFGLINPESVAFHRLKKLKQGRGPASDYAASFRSLSADLDWDEKALIQHFEDGLNPEVKKLVLFSAPSKTLDDAISTAVLADQRLFQIRQDEFFARERPGLRPVLPRGPPGPPGPPPAAPFGRHDGPMPMEIGNAGRVPLTPEERQRRLNLKLCLVCGEAGHMKYACPQAYQNRFYNQGNVKDQ